MRQFLITKKGAREIKSSGFTSEQVRQTSLDGYDLLPGDMSPYDKIIEAFGKIGFNINYLRNKTDETQGNLTTAQSLWTIQFNSLAASLSSQLNAFSASANAMINQMRRVRYTKTIFTPHSSTANIVTASIPLVSEDMEGKFCALRFVFEKIGSASIANVILYHHNEAVADGSPVPGGATVIATYNGAANQNDFPFERIRMFVKNARLYFSRQATSRLSDNQTEGAIKEHVILTPTSHILVVTSLVNAADSFVPQMLTFEY